MHFPLLKRPAVRRRRRMIFIPIACKLFCWPISCSKLWCVFTHALFYCFPPAAVRHNAPPPQVHSIGGLRLVRRLLLLHRGPRRGRARRRGSRVGIEAQGRKEEYLLTLSPFMCTWGKGVCVCGNCGERKTRLRPTPSTAPLWIVFIPPCVKVQ